MKEKQKKINYIVSIIENSEVAQGQLPTDSEFLSMISTIICQFDTDIAIEVMKNLEKRFGDDAKEEVVSIEVNYGY